MKGCTCNTPGARPPCSYCTSMSEDDVFYLDAFGPELLQKRYERQDQGICHCLGERICFVCVKDIVAHESRCIEAAQSALESNRVTLFNGSHSGFFININRDCGCAGPTICPSCAKQLTHEELYEIAQHSIESIEDAENQRDEFIEKYHKQSIENAELWEELILKDKEIEAIKNHFGFDIADEDTFDHLEVH